VGIVASGDQNKLWFEAPGYRCQDIFKDCLVFLIAPAGDEGDINGKSFAIPSSNFINTPGSGVKRVLVGREIKDMWVSIKGVLCAVAVVDIEINDEDSSFIVAGRGGNRTSLSLS